MCKAAKWHTPKHHYYAKEREREREERNIDTIFDKNGKINGQIVLITVTT